MADTIKDKHVLYRFYSSTGQLLYVGITMNPQARFGQHSKDKSWWDEVAGITMEHYPSRSDLESAERRAIKVEQPLHNKVRYGQRASSQVAAGTAPSINCFVCDKPLSSTRPGWIDLPEEELLRYRDESIKADEHIKSTMRSVRVPGTPPAEQGARALRAIRASDVPVVQKARWRAYHTNECSRYFHHGMPEWECEWQDVRTAELLLLQTTKMCMKFWFRETNWDVFVARAFTCWSGYGRLVL